MGGEQSPPIYILPLHFDFTALRTFYLCQWGKAIIVFGNVCVKYCAVMFCHVKGGVAQKPLERKRISAAVHQILFCECVTKQVNTCLFHAAPPVVLGNRTPQAVFRQLYAVLIGKQVFIPIAAAYPHILPQNAAEGFTKGDNLRPLVFGMPQINHFIFNVHVFDLDITDGGTLLITW